MYEDKYHFITFTLFSDLLSCFGFEMIISEPDPIRILGLTFRSEPNSFVNDRIGLSGFRVPFTAPTAMDNYKRCRSKGLQLWVQTDQIHSRDGMIQEITQKRLLSAI